MNSLTKTRSADPSRFLRYSLRANGVFSTLSGFAFLGASRAVAGVLGDVPPALVASVGAQLVLFAAALVWIASRDRPPRSLVIGVICADLAWVLGTIVVVQAELLSSGGTTLAIAIADVVLVLAILQSVGLYKAGSPRDEVRS
jgi:hypothetical protein